MEISDRELYSQYDRQQRERAEAHRRVLTRVVQTVRDSCTRGAQYCRYQIPEAIIMGLPYPIDQEDCAEYILAHLHLINRKLRGEYLGDGVLYLDWKRRED